MFKQISKNLLVYYTTKLEFVRTCVKLAVFAQNQFIKY